MQKQFLMVIAILWLLCGVVPAQQSGTVNSLSVNPRQNQELTNSTGTESGQPSDAVVGSDNQPNGLAPVTSNMVGSGSNGHMSQAQSTEKTAGARSSEKAAQPSAARKNTTKRSQAGQ